jgi:FkbM family methyltransferase
MKFLKRILLKYQKSNIKKEWDLRIERDNKNIKKLLRTYLKENSNCIDIGANKGFFLKQFITLAPYGTHCAFEPIPKLSELLKTNFPNVNIYSCALGNKNDSVNFYWVPELESWSGLEKQNYPKNVNPIEIKVKIDRLDDIIDQEIPIDFIKIDVEGAELEVLYGSIKTIKRYHPIIYFEHARIHNQNYKTSPELVFDFLSLECNMKICDIENIKTFTKESFRQVYDVSYESNYDRNSQTNFIAIFQ